jgi:hypothetical protein
MLRLKYIIGVLVVAVVGFVLVAAEPIGEPCQWSYHFTAIGYGVLQEQEAYVTVTAEFSTQPCGSDNYSFAIAFYDVYGNGTAYTFTMPEGSYRIKSPYGLFTDYADAAVVGSCTNCRSHGTCLDDNPVHIRIFFE